MGHRKGRGLSVLITLDFFGIGSNERCMVNLEAVMSISFPLYLGITRIYKTLFRCWLPVPCFNKLLCPLDPLFRSSKYVFFHRCAGRGGGARQEAAHYAGCSVGGRAARHRVLSQRAPAAFLTAPGRCSVEPCRVACSVENPRRRVGGGRRGRGQEKWVQKHPQGGTGHGEIETFGWEAAFKCDWWRITYPWEIIWFCREYFCIGLWRFT